MNRLAFTFGMGTSLGLFIGQHHNDKVEFALKAVRQRVLPEFLSAQVKGSGGDPTSTAESLLEFSIVTANKNKFAVLTTLSAEIEKGTMSSRTIQPFEIELEEGSPIVYFNTSRLSRCAGLHCVCMCVCVMCVRIWCEF